MDNQIPEDAYRILARERSHEDARQTVATNRMLVQALVVINGAGAITVLAYYGAAHNPSGRNNGSQTRPTRARSAGWLRRLVRVAQYSNGGKYCGDTSGLVKICRYLLQGREQGDHVVPGPTPGDYFPDRKQHVYTAYVRQLKQVAD